MHVWCVVPSIRNEAPYLREWIEYHRMIGFEAFLLMNDNSTDDTQCILEAYSEEGIVIRMPDDFQNISQDLYERNDYVFDACADYLQNYQDRFDAKRTWMSTHDTDEFVWFNKKKGEHETLNKALHNLVSSRKTKAESVFVPRLVVGSSGHDHYEPGLVIERFNHRFDYDSCDGRKRDKKRDKGLEKKRDKSRQRRRLFDHYHPISYCEEHTKKDSTDNGKSVSLVSSLAQNCKTKKGFPTMCTRTHRHTLVERKSKSKNRSQSASTIASIKADERYLDRDVVGSSIAIMHYVTKSR